MTFNLFVTEYSPLLHSKISE